MDSTNYGTFAGHVVPSVSLMNFINQRAAVMEKLAAAVELIKDAADIAKAANLGMPRIIVSREYGRGGHDVDVASARLGVDRNGARGELDAKERAEIRDAVRVAVDAAGWQYLMTQSGMRSLMDADARKKWDKMIGEGEMPELTAENIRATFGMLHDGRGEMFERGVIKCFKELSWDYKTNSPYRFGKRVVFKYLTGWHMHEKCDKLDDLMRVLCVLDGKPEPDYRGGTYALLSRARLEYAAGETENDYLHIRTFKNQNGHITFKRPDLVDRMNDIIAKHYPGALPFDKHAAKNTDHDQVTSTGVPS